MQEDPTGKKGNVTPITDGKKDKERKKPSQEEVKLKAGEVHRLISDAIKGRTVLPKFPRRYGVLEPEVGARVPVIVEDDESLRVMRTSALANDILSYTETALAGRPEFAIEPYQAKAAADYYMMTATPIKPSDVKMLRWKSEPGLTYRRLPWDLASGHAPTWEALLSRMTNHEAFLAWVGSLFFEDSSLHNYVWLYGVGGDGKGSINRFLAKVFDYSYRSKQPPSGGKSVDKFWTYGLLGARLVVLPDCDDYTFVSRGLFKSLTGGDPVDVEAKGQMSFTTRLNTKFLVISNEKPSLSSEKADMRRIIYCELGTAESFSNDFENRLWEEGGAFLTACVMRYQQNYPDHGPIASGDEEISSWVATLEEPFEVIFEKWFTIRDGGYVAPRDMQRMLKQEWASGQRRPQLDFLRWLEKTHHVRRRRMSTTSGVRFWGYRGIELTAPKTFQDLLDS